MPIAWAPGYDTPGRRPKARLVMAAWWTLDVPLSIIPVVPLSPSELFGVHDPEYVRGILTGERRNGNNDTDPAVGLAALWRCGGVVAAARHAVTARCAVAVPTTGFHHAHWRLGVGWCTFNGHMAAAHCLLAEGLVHKVAVIDLDRHWGDGTADILERVPMPAGGIEHYSFSAEALGRLGVDGPQAAERWLGRLADDIASLAGRGCDFVIYNAGVDPHVDDPMGGFLSTIQLRRRDAIVFTTCRDAGLPLVLTLGGGYRRPYSLVVASHAATLSEMWGALGT